MTGILLAGGKSSRMGKDKAFLSWKGRKLYTYPMQLMEEFCSEILVSSSDERFLDEGYRIIPDIIQDIGPLGGIYTCLNKAKFDRSLVLTCDNPLISKKFIGKLLINSKDYLITIGKNSEHLPEPLSGVYNKKVLKLMKQQINSGDNKMSNLLDHPGVNIIDPKDYGLDPDIIFFNVNTLKDLEKLRKSE